MQDRTGIVWSEEETTLALYLYYLIESGQVDNRSKSIKDLATFLGRTPGSVEMKIGNLQFYDKKNSKGLKNGGKTDELIFNRYLLHPDDLDFNAKKIIDKNPIDSYLIDSIIKTNPYEARSSLEVKEDYTGTNQTVVIKQ
ncbi:MAG: hypothetical protein HUK24_07280, partial [Sphaerochaetaceae bacterium]|nr:hypothetical protein [Sphaerochaetaceae bacterium]